MNATASLHTIEDVAPLSSNDHECLNEIRQVLEKHGQLDRFGVCLLHKHFDLTDEEALVESCSHADRTLTLRPISRSEFRIDQVVETSWRLDGKKPEPVTLCRNSGPVGMIH